MEEELRKKNYGRKIMEEELWKKNYGRKIMEEKLWKKNYGRMRITEKNGRRIIKEKSRRNNKLEKWEEKMEKQQKNCKREYVKDYGMRIY